MPLVDITAWMASPVLMAPVVRGIIQIKFDREELGDSLDSATVLVLVTMGE